LIKAPHVQLQGLFGGGLAAHAVAPAANGNGAGMPAHGFDDLLQLGRCQDLRYFDGIHTADVVDGFGGVHGLAQEQDKYGGDAHGASLFAVEK
jgi:hypothetical protein